jgi:signal transduction histidine kinase
MKTRENSLTWNVLVAALFLVPLGHPLLIPFVGVPSHLLWFVHVLPVALFTFRYGRSAAVASVLVSVLMVNLGEGLMGRGYWLPADAETEAALTIALLATNLLIVSFSLYAREVGRRYRVLFERVNMGVIRVDGDDRVARINPAALQILGFGDSEPVTGRPVSDFIRIGDAALLETVGERGGWTGEVEVVGPEGTRAIHALVAAVSEPGNRGYQLLLADRSTEVMQEQEIERQAKLASLGEALAGVAHELNNPLTVILAHAQLGQVETVEGTGTRESFDVIDHEAARMRDLVQELLGFSRKSEEGECAILGDVLQRVARVQRIAIGKRIRIEEELLWDGPVRASAIKIEQILLNLMSNAAYAVRKGGGSAITIASREVDGVIEVEVRDDGPGIDGEILDRLFEPFATTKPEGEGTGLGLAISRRLARAWRGDLTARNLTGKGAAFTLTLRIPAADDEACESALTREKMIA